MKIDIYPAKRWKPYCSQVWCVWRGGERLGEYRNLEEMVVGAMRRDFPCDSIIVHREPRKRKRM